MSYSGWVVIPSKNYPIGKLIEGVTFHASVPLEKSNWIEDQTLADCMERWKWINLLAIFISSLASKFVCLVAILSFRASFTMNVVLTSRFNRDDFYYDASHVHSLDVRLLTHIQKHVLLFFSSRGLSGGGWNCSVLCHLEHFHFSEHMHTSVQWVSTIRVWLKCCTSFR